MDDRYGHDVEPVERRLRAERGELSRIELDGVKQGVLAKAARQGGRGMASKSRLAMVLLVIGLVGTGGGAVIAASGGSSSNGSSANSQYCPPSSPGGGKPKHQHGNKCGHPKDCDSADKGGNGDNGKGKDKGKGNDEKKKKCKEDKKHQPDGDGDADDGGSGSGD